MYSLCVFTFGVWNWDADSHETYVETRWKSLLSLFIQCSVAGEGAVHPELHINANTFPPPGNLEQPVNLHCGRKPENPGGTPAVKEKNFTHKGPGRESNPKPSCCGATHKPLNPTSHSTTQYLNVATADKSKYLYLWSHAFYFSKIILQQFTRSRCHTMISRVSDNPNPNIAMINIHIQWSLQLYRIDKQ